MVISNIQITAQDRLKLDRISREFHRVCRALRSGG
jgi:hypothetical protein